jgi:insulysin
LLKSANEIRQYKHIELANGMRILLIQDVDCEKSACSVTFNVGHFNDDNDCHGISHLLEHMLFLGNKNYPEPNGFSNFLDKHNGNIDASTGTEYTSYFYDLSHEHEQQGLALLFAMITNPTFDKQLIEKEINAIDAEFSLKQKDDLRRLYQVHKETCNPAHPFSKFSVGNKHTFSPFSPSQLQQKLQDIHSHYYQPHNACLCFISKQNLKTSEHLVKQQFSDWKSIYPLSLIQHPPLYLPHQLGIQIDIAPIQKAQRLILTFALPSQRAYFRSKPLSILSNILGDEGDGCLLDFYKSQNWATTLSAGGGIEGSSFKDFNINLQLTDVGVTHIDQVITALFSYIHLIRTQGIEKWRIAETATLNQLIWDFTDKTKPIDEALHFNLAMFEYPENFILAGDYVLDELKPKLVLKMLNLFTPDNLRIKFIHSRVQATNIAKWYNTPYSVSALNSSRIKVFLSQKWASSFVLPKANPFIGCPKKPQTVNPEYNLPRQIINEDGLDIWYGQDNKFQHPKGDCFLTFDCPAVNDGIETTTSKRLWVALINEKLNQQYYQADIAGMHFHLYPHQYGFSLQTNGFSNHQLDFCNDLLTQIVKVDNFEQNFSQIKNRLHQGLSNVLLNKPINRLFSVLSVLMQKQSHAQSDMAVVMANLTLDSVISSKHKLLSQFHLQGLMYGDWQLDDALKVSAKLKEFRGQYNTNSKLDRSIADVRYLPPVIHRVTSNHKDPAVVIYFQAPDGSLKNVALTILMEQLIASPFFNQLRTEQQLGYLVGSGYIPYDGHPGIGFYIQSPHSTVVKLIDAIHQFLQNLVENIQQYESVWPMIKSGVIKQLTESDTNLSMKSQRLWMSIGNRDDTFSYNKNVIQTILDTSFYGIKTYLTNLTAGQDFGEVILYSGELHISPKMSDSLIISDIKQFKATSKYL